MPHPYTHVPDIGFWSRAVARAFDPAALVHAGEPLIRPGDKVMSAGSCFAANLIPYLKANGFTYQRTEYVNPFFQDIQPERLSYAKFSAGYGNVYTARQLLQLLRRARGTFRALEDRWYTPSAVIDAFRPGLRYNACTDREFDALTAQHLACVDAAFRSCDVFIFTLGLTEAWVSTLDGAVFPACPGTMAGSFDADRHAFHNFDASEIAADLDAFRTELAAINPQARIILTVSPVPLVATASGRHVLCATTYSKAVLRVAAEQAAAASDAVTYFPAYEIVTGPQAAFDVFEEDRRSVSQAGIAMVMDAFLKACGIETALCAQPTASAPTTQSFAERIVAIECEEAAADAPT